MKKVEIKTFKHEELGTKEAVEFFNRAKKLSDVRYVINIYTADMLESKRKIEEITDLCIDERLHAVAFRLFVTDEGAFLRLQKYQSKK